MTCLYPEAPLLGTARVATAVSHFLAEGPVWDPARSRLLWVDIRAGAVHCGSLREDGTIRAEERIDFPDTAGAVAVSVTGALVVAGTDRLYYRDADGTVASSPPLIAGAGRRFNDGKPDPAGRFVVGTLGAGANEQLLVIDETEAVTVLDDDLTLANGLAWTRDGRRLYTVDTLTRRIRVRDYDPATGRAGAPRLFIELEHGYPDGLTIDAEEHVWVSVWGGGCVLRLSPEGRIVGRVDVPAPHTSCAAFAGPDLDTLVITTALEDLTAQQREQHPLSGRLFTVKPGVRGLPAPLWTAAHRITAGERTIT